MFSTTRQLLAYCAMALSKKIYVAQKCGPPHSGITYESHIMEKNLVRATVAANSGSESNKPRSGYNRDVRLLIESVAISSYQEVEKACKRTKEPYPSFCLWLKENSIKIVGLPDSAQFWLRSK